MKIVLWKSCFLALLCTLCLLAAPASAQSDEDCCVVPGDANNDGQVNIGDVIRILDTIWKCAPPPECPNAADANGDCGYNVGDAIYLVRYIFNNGPAPVCGCVNPVEFQKWLAERKC
jgi:hypothetical protein